MSTVHASSDLGSLLDGNVLDNQGINVQVLGNSVALGILQQSGQELDALGGPSALGDAKLLGLASATETTVVAAEGNASLVLTDLTEVLEGLLELHALDGVGSLEHVLEVGPQVTSTGLA